MDYDFTIIVLQAPIICTIAFIAVTGYVFFRGLIAPVIGRRRLVSTNYNEIRHLTGMDRLQLRPNVPPALLRVLVNDDITFGHFFSYLSMREIAALKGTASCIWNLLARPCFWEYLVKDRIIPVQSCDACRGDWIEVVTSALKVPNHYRLFQAFWRLKSRLVGFWRIVPDSYEREVTGQLLVVRYGMPGEGLIGEIVRLDGDVNRLYHIGYNEYRGVGHLLGVSAINGLKLHIHSEDEGILALQVVLHSQPDSSYRKLHSRDYFRCNPSVSALRAVHHSQALSSYRKLRFPDYSRCNPSVTAYHAELRPCLGLCTALYMSTDNEMFDLSIKLRGERTDAKTEHSMTDMDARIEGLKIIGDRFIPCCELSFVVDITRHPVRNTDLLALLFTNTSIANRLDNIHLAFECKTQVAYIDFRAPSWKKAFFVVYKTPLSGNGARFSILWSGFDDMVYDYIPHPLREGYATDALNGLRRNANK